MPSKQGYVVGHGDAAHNRHAARNAANTCGYFVPLLKPQYHVLDAGCGPGSISASLARLVPEGRVVGIDYADVVVDKARQQPDLPSNCSFEVADLTKLPFADGSFDVVHTNQTLVHVPDSAAALREMYRVCRPGGFLASKEGDFPALLLHPKPPALELWHKVVVAIMESGGGHASGGRQLLGWVLDAGFSQKGLQLTMGGLVHVLDNVAAIQAFLERVTKDEAWRQKALDLGLVVESDFDKIAAAWNDFLANPGAMWGMPCSEIVAYKP